MPTTFERPAPAPEQHPSDDELHRIVYGSNMNVGAPHEPDVIEYNHPAGNWSTTREERARAAQAWKDEGQVPHPDNAAENLARTERMLRLRIAHMNPQETVAAVPDTLAIHNERMRNIELAHSATELDTSWETDATGNFVQPQTQNEAAPEEPEYTGRHRRRGMRIPLHRLIRRHKPRHAA